MRAAVADPGNEAAVKVDSSAVLGSVSAHDRGIDRNDVLRWQLVVERELDGRTPLSNDDAAQVSRELTGSAQWNCGIESPKRSRPKAGVKLVSELANI